MRWTLFIQQKMKVAALLFSIMFFVILTSVIGGRNIKNINQLANSIYNDRLVPATDVYYISDHLHRKKALLESLLVIGGKTERVVQEIDHLNQKINRLITHFETTYLVNGETHFMSRLKQNQQHYNTAEQHTIRLINGGMLTEAHRVFNTRITTAHEKNVATLGKLMSIQSAVGKDLIAQTQLNASSFNLLSTLQIILAGVIGALIVKLVMASRILHISQEKYTMN